mgnify:CR=1 FL=1
MGEVVTDIFTYTIYDGRGGRDSTTLTVTSTGTNDAPVLDAAGNISAASPALQISVSAAPQLLNSSVDGLGNVLKLYFSEVLDPATVPAASQFTVTNGTAQTVTGVQVVDNQVILTLAAPLSAAQAVTVGFAGGANGLQDVAGNDVAAISGAQVTNWLSQVQSLITLQQMNIL